MIGSSTCMDKIQDGLDNLTESKVSIGVNEPRGYVHRLHSNTPLRKTHLIAKQRAHGQPPEWAEEKEESYSL